MTLQPQTLIALQKFLNEWYTDPVSQNNLLITPQNIILSNNEDVTQQVDLTSVITRTDNIDIEPEIEPITLDIQEDELLTFNETGIELTELFTPDFESKKVHQIYNKLNRQEQPTTTSQMNPFLANTWKDQVEQILDRLKETRHSKLGYIGILEAHYYLGKIISKNRENQDQVRAMLQQQYSDRKVRDMWKGAIQLREVFEIKPLGLLYQIRKLNITQIMKLTETEYMELLQVLKL